MKLKEFDVVFYKNNEEIYKDTHRNNLNEENRISFPLLDYDTTIDLKEETFLRENNEYIFYLDIKNKKCKIELKKEAISFDVLVEECSMEMIGNKIILEYFIETDEARNKIVIKERSTIYE